MTDTPKPGLLNTALRITGAGAEAASGRIAAAVGGARELTERATGRVSTAVGEATSAVASALPDAGTVKRGFGRALILGGKALIDPGAVVGGFAVELGQRMAADEAAPTWLALVASDAGFDVLARGEEAAVRAAAAEAAAQQRAVLVCKVMEAHSAPQTAQPARPAPPG